MKKLCSLLLAAALVFSGTAWAFADDLTPSNTAGGTTITFDATLNYVVHIPASMAYDRRNGNTLSFSAEVGYLPAGQSVVVRIGNVPDGALMMNSGSDSFFIPVTLGGAPCAEGAVVARFDANGAPDNSMGALRLEAGADAPTVGQYTGMPTFSVSVE